MNDKLPDVSLQNIDNPEKKEPDLELKTFGRSSPGISAAQNYNTKFGSYNQEVLKTDVEGIDSDGVKNIGKDKYPVFDVEFEDFMKNSHTERRRLRFPQGSKVQEFNQKTKYRAPFFIRTKDTQGRTYEKKIK